MDISRITVATDDDDGEQAIYKDGKLVECDDTIYACDIAEHARHDEPIYFSHVIVEHATRWPDTLDELKVLKRTS